MSWISYMAAGVVAALILRLLFSAFGRMLFGGVIAVAAGLICTSWIAGQVPQGDVPAVMILGYLVTLWLIIQAFALLDPESAAAPCTLGEWLLVPASALRNWGGW